MLITWDICHYCRVDVPVLTIAFSQRRHVGCTGFEHFNETKSLLWSEIHVFIVGMHVLFLPTANNNKQQPRECAETRQYFSEWNSLEHGGLKVRFQLLLILSQTFCTQNAFGFSSRMTPLTVVKVLVRFHPFLRFHLREINDHAII